MQCYFDYSDCIIIAECAQLSLRWYFSTKNWNIVSDRDTEQVKLEQNDGNCFKNRYTE